MLEWLFLYLDSGCGVLPWACGWRTGLAANGILWPAKANLATSAIIQTGKIRGEDPIRRMGGAGILSAMSLTKQQSPHHLIPYTGRRAIWSIGAVLAKGTHSYHEASQAGEQPAIYDHGQRRQQTSIRRHVTKRAAT
ncbi:hypothetical protein Nepgr_017428 [Nepenthes gracilis]|uniref:Uncharacterized protein n=1 Tax=Nepenthes gracilis TaxID=150966 RepID=A0AAD3SSD0_NEPGR|nr:hypothetical protein Nepgr_017428 [Nepenthes gracilis]